MARTPSRPVWPRTVRLTSAKVGIRFDVPIRAARAWDDEYERKRAVAFMDLWGKAHDMAVGQVHASLDYETVLRPLRDEKGRKFARAVITARVFDLSEVPACLRERAREFSESMIGVRDVLDFIIPEPARTSSENVAASREGWAQCTR